jgi:2-methylcitrate dehydratase PrpD
VAAADNAAGPTAARTLARFATRLAYADVPQLDRDRIKQCLIDAIGVALQGSRLPWGQMIAEYARHYGGAGTSRLIGKPQRVAAPLAALANGVFAHGFELDSLRKPGVGVHPGAALVPPALALGEELGIDGITLLTALIAGCEVMFRIGLASRHSSEHLGFHAPGLTGPYGAAVTGGRILGLDEAQMCNAIGIAGSLGGGILAFAKAGNGAMIKRLHLGRAAEAGVLAARLAKEGFEGPDSVLEGKFGFLETYCEESDATLLTKGLGEHFETHSLCLKHYPCHVTAHTPLQSIEAMRAEHAFTASDVAHVTVLGSAKMVSHHSERNPRDTMAAQYSVPYCVALGICDDPHDPDAYMERGLADPRIRRLCSEIECAVLPDNGSKRSSWASEVRIRLNEGRELVHAADDFKGTCTMPLTREELRDKFHRCAPHFAAADRLLEELEAIESVADVRTLSLA